MEVWKTMRHPGMEERAVQRPQKRQPERRARALRRPQPRTRAEENPVQETQLTLAKTKRLAIGQNKKHVKRGDYFFSFFFFFFTHLPDSRLDGILGRTDAAGATEAGGGGCFGSSRAGRLSDKRTEEKERKKRKKRKETMRERDLKRRVALFMVPTWIEQEPVCGALSVEAKRNQGVNHQLVRHILAQHVVQLLQSVMQLLLFGLAHVGLLVEHNLWRSWKVAMASSQ
jgi:hypothetical protein